MNWVRRAMKQPVGGITFPAVASASGLIWRAAIIKNTTEDTVQLKAVRTGDMVTVGGVPLRVKNAQRDDAGLVTLKIENGPARPMTMVGVPDMRVVRASAP